MQVEELTALPVRLVAVPYAALAPQWLVAVNLLAGSLAGAWAGASWATRMRTATLHKVLAGLIVLMAVELVFTHLDDPTSALGLHGWVQALVGVVVGFGVGVVAAVMGVAGGELLSRRPCCSTAWTSSLRAVCRWRCPCRRCWSLSPATAVIRPSPSCAGTAGSLVPGGGRRPLVPFR